MDDLNMNLEIYNQPAMNYSAEKQNVPEIIRSSTARINIKKEFDISDFKTSRSQVSRSIL